LGCRLAADGRPWQAVIAHQPPGRRGAEKKRRGYQDEAARVPCGSVGEGRAEALRCSLSTYTGEKAPRKEGPRTECARKRPLSRLPSPSSGFARLSRHPPPRSVL